MGVSQVSLTIENVDTEAGTLDIIMTNTTACSYCSDADFSDKFGCENFGNSMAGATWNSDSNMEQSACCTAYPEDEIGQCTDSALNTDCPDGICDAWFDGKIGGFQFGMSGITVNSATGGTAETNGFAISILNDLLLAYSLSGSTIPAGSSQVLTTIAFSDAGDAICFAEQDCETTGACSNVVSNAIGVSLESNWGNCYCSDSNPADECGVCGGSNEDKDCAGVCFGDTVDADADGICDDGTDTCLNTPSTEAANVNAEGCSESQLSISQISTYMPDEFAIAQNFPNPFNPVTSITFDVAEIDEVSLVVYDLTGKEVATLISGTYTPGSYNVEWNAVNNAGDGIVSGMYIYRYISSNKSITRKMLYLK